MPIAAAPAYLGRDFKDASPGMRFGLLLPIWTSRQDQEDEVRKRAEAKSREGDEVRALLQRGMDQAIAQLRKREIRALAGVWNKSDFAARAAWRNICLLSASDVERSKAWAARQAACAAPLAAAGRLLTMDAKSTAPFTTGLGNEHPLENGFAFLNPYGLPYLPGSGVKGVLRQAARELARGEWGDTQGWDEDAITFLFGLESENGSQVHQRGALMFWDVLPQLAGGSLQVEVMTPHQTHYYQKGKDPHDSGQPNPICFLAVPPESRFTFHVQCDVPFLRQHDSALAEQGRWQALVQAAFEHAFAWLGFGAKTAVGYGAMGEDAAARLRRQQAEAERQRAAAEAAEAARKKCMSPEDVAWEEAQAAVEAFRAEYQKARAAGAFNPGGPFNQLRLEFMRKALAWTEPRSRAAAGQALADSATKAWGRPSNKDTWAKLQAAIHELQGKSS